VRAPAVALVERDDDRTKILGSLERRHHVILSGRTGTGKSALLADIGTRLKNGKRVVVAVKCSASQGVEQSIASALLSERERRSVFLRTGARALRVAPIRIVARVIAAGLSVLGVDSSQGPSITPEPWATLAEVATGARTGIDVIERGLTALSKNAASPVLLIDNGELDLGIVEVVAGRSAIRRAACVVVVNTDIAEADQVERLRTMSVTSGTTWHMLPGLTVDGVIAFCRQRGIQIDRQEARDAARVCDGRPLVLSRWLKLLPNQRTVSSQDIDILEQISEESLQPYYLKVLRELRPPSHAVVTALALMGRALRASDVRRAFADLTDDDLRVLVNSGILAQEGGRIDLAHDSVRSAGWRPLMHSAEYAGVMGALSNAELDRLHPTPLESRVLLTAPALASHDPGAVDEAEKLIEDLEQGGQYYQEERLGLLAHDAFAQEPMESAGFRAQLLGVRVLSAHAEYGRATQLLHEIRARGSDALVDGHLVDYWETRLAFHLCEYARAKASLALLQPGHPEWRNAQRLLCHIHRNEGDPAAAVAISEEMVRLQADSTTSALHARNLACAGRIDEALTLMRAFDVAGLGPREGGRVEFVAGEVCRHAGRRDEAKIAYLKAVKLAEGARDWDCLVYARIGLVDIERGSSANSAREFLDALQVVLARSPGGHRLERAHASLLDRLLRGADTSGVEAEYAALSLPAPFDTDAPLKPLRI